MDRDARITLREAAWIANVPTGTVRNWRYRGWTDSNGDRRYLDVNAAGYLHSDVVEAERDTRTHPRSHRRLPAPSLVA